MMYGRGNSVLPYCNNYGTYANEFDGETIRFEEDWFPKGGTAAYH
jgi:hypothetical protein